VAIRPPKPNEKGASPKKAPRQRKSPQTSPDPLSSPAGTAYLTQIYPNPDQPRKIFNKAKLEELAQSIKEQGLIEPLVVVKRPIKDTVKVFMLVAGERRWRACRIAGLTMVPVRILKANDNQIAEMALVENIQRQDLTPLEEAKAFKEMLGRGYTREDLAQKLGFKQAWRIDERLSLLNLSSKYQDALTFGAISPSQAFEISRLQDAESQEIVFQKIGSGALPTYNHLRKFVSAMIDSKREKTLFVLPKKEDLETISRWEKALDAVTGLLVKSFGPDDCDVLAKVMNGNSAANLQKIDMIVRHLNLIKKALLENASKQEVQSLKGGDSLFPAPSFSNVANMESG
jgi:ParB family chromosome partitioning protein